MGYPQMEPTVLGEDNISSIAMINNDSNGEKPKQNEIFFNLIREQVQKQIMQLQHIIATEMISDILSKPLEPKPFLHLRTKLLGMLIKASSRGVQSVSQ